MTGKKFLTFLAIIFTITAVAYYFTVPHDKEVVLVGVVEAAALLRAGPSMEMVTGAVLIAGATVWLLRGEERA